MSKFRRCLSSLSPFPARPYGKLGTFVGVTAHGFALVNPAGTAKVYSLPSPETEKLVATCVMGDSVVLGESGDPHFRYTLLECLPRDAGGEK
jgi:hypothetical protein